MANTSVSATATNAANRASDGTSFTIKFDFESEDQNTILQFLQKNNYQLLAFKGASGPTGQVTIGVPTWFVEPFSKVMGSTTITYTPLYQAYMYSEDTIGPNTTISMTSHSAQVPLGTNLVMDQTGKFSPGTGSGSQSSITVQDTRTSGAPITIGLAALVNGTYQPFCAFTSTPGDSIEMTPHEKVCLFAARLGLQSGSVQAIAANPGVSFEFDSLNHQLAFSNDGQYAVIGVDQNIDELVSSKDDLVKLLNS